MVVGVKVVAEHFAIRIGYRIDDYMIVQVAFVQMGADRTLKPIRKKPPCKFTANLMYLVGRGFTGAETLDDVVGQNITLIHRLIPAFLCAVHSAVSSGRVTSEPRHI